MYFVSPTGTRQMDISLVSAFFSSHSVFLISLGDITGMAADGHGPWMEAALRGRAGLGLVGTEKCF
jgi:hypothetical protein